MCGKPACPARYSHNLLVSGHLVTWRQWAVVTSIRVPAWLWSPGAGRPAPPGLRPSHL